MRLANVIIIVLLLLFLASTADSAPLPMYDTFMPIIANDGAIEATPTPTATITLPPPPPTDTPTPEK